MFVAAVCNSHSSISNRRTLGCGNEMALASSKIKSPKVSNLAS